MEERSKDRHSWKDKKGLATKLYSFKHDPLCPQVNSKEGEDDLQVNGEMQFLDSGSANLETYLTSSALDNELEEGIDLQDQVRTSLYWFICTEWADVFSNRNKKTMCL